MEIVPSGKVFLHNKAYVIYVNSVESMSQFFITVIDIGILVVTGLVAVLEFRLVGAAARALRCPAASSPWPQFYRDFLHAPAPRHRSDPLVTWKDYFKDFWNLSELFTVLVRRGGGVRSAPRALTPLALGSCTC